MGGYFGVASKSDCVFDLFFGTDYHSHLGTKRAGMCVYGDTGFERAIHNIENSPFRTKFEHDVEEMKGNIGIGCISDNDPQPIILRSHLGNFAIVTVGTITNIDELVAKSFADGTPHFLEMSGGVINSTELCAVLINHCDSIPEGIKYAQSLIKGSISMMIMTSEGIYCARDFHGRTPMVIGHKEGAYCATFESFAYLNLGYENYRELGPGEIDFITAESCEIIEKPREEMKICAFLWVYYGYPSTCYEGVSVEEMRCRCGRMLARRDGDIGADSVAGVPDSGTAHAIGYANESGVPFSRPFIKYTPTWPRSFMPQKQSQRNFIAHMKLIPVDKLIRDRSLVLIDDSIVRGTQLGETTEFLYHSGAKQVHIRLACPPILYSCKYLNFSRATSDLDLIARRVIGELEGDPNAKLDKYSDPDTPEYAAMLERIRQAQHFTTLSYQRLDDMVEALGIPKCKLCTYCWDGRE